MDLAARIIARLGQLKSERAPHENHWRECYKYGAPERQQGFNGELVHDTRKTERADLLDSTAAEALQLLVSSIVSGTTPASGLWFKSVPDGVDDSGETTEGEQWLSAVDRFIWRNIHASNFDSENFDSVTDSTTAGWSVLYTDIDRKDNGGFVFQNWPLSECYLASTRQDMRVDTVYREFEMTASALKSEYGEDKLPESLKQALKTSPDKKYKVIWAIEPRADYKEPQDDRPLLPKQMPFSSVHILSSERTILKESGYNEFPCAVPRFRRIAGSVYGVGQMSVALPDAKTANILMRETLQSAQLAVGGMWAAADDGVFNPYTFKIGPRKVVIVNDVDKSPKRIDDGTNFQVSDQLIDRLQSSIRKKLMADQLQAQNGPQMTATEVHVRVELIRQQLGPLYGRWLSEYLVPILERCFGLAYRDGVLGDPPEDLQGKELKYKFISPLARAQQLEEVTATERVIGSAMSMADANPEVLDNLDLDAAVQVIGNGLGVPSNILRTEAQKQQIREQRAQAQQAQAQQEQQAVAAQQMTGAMAKGVEHQLTSEVMQ